MSPEILKVVSDIHLDEQRLQTTTQLSGSCGHNSNLSHQTRVLSPCIKGMAGGARLAPISHVTKATKLHHQALATHLDEGRQQLPPTRLF